jgi:hypothetical protein
MTETNQDDEPGTSENRPVAFLLGSRGGKHRLLTKRATRTGPDSVLGRTPGTNGQGLGRCGAGFSGFRRQHLVVSPGRSESWSCSLRIGKRAKPGKLSDPIRETPDLGWQTWPCATCKTLTPLTLRRGRGDPSLGTGTSGAARGTTAHSAGEHCRRMPHPARHVHEQRDERETSLHKQSRGNAIFRADFRKPIDDGNLTAPVHQCPSALLNSKLNIPDLAR